MNNYTNNKHIDWIKVYHISILYASAITFLLTFMAALYSGDYSVIIMINELGEASVEFVLAWVWICTLPIYFYMRFCEGQY